MVSVATSSAAFAEHSRLGQLIPPDWPERIVICSSPEQSRKSGWLKTSSLLITTRQRVDRSFVITIDSQQWHKLEEHVRDLLWWHELARIQQHTVGFGRSSFLWGTGVFGLTVLPLAAQDVILLSIGLTVTGLAGFRYYQEHYGEQYLRSLTRADWGAINLATQFGYSPRLSYESLHSALKIMVAQVTTGNLAKVYRTRLEVLEIADRENNICSGKSLANPPIPLRRDDELISKWQ
jgi:Protein of unknown function (DUF3318)